MKFSLLLLLLFSLLFSFKENFIEFNNKSKIFKINESKLIFALLNLILFV